ncbi:MAG: adenylate kinase [Nautiliaceae bacterium]
MILYYGLIAVGIILVVLAVYNFYSISKIEKNMDNYLFIITSNKSYFIGTTLFSLALLIIIAYQANGYIFDIKIFSIVFFFGSLFLLALSHLIYYMQAKKKLSDYEKFFKEFELDLNNNCEKLMLKYIYSKEKDLKKAKKIFKMNKKLCKKKD